MMTAQTRQQMSGRDLYVFTVKLLALKKAGFFTFLCSKFEENYNKMIDFFSYF